MLANLLLHVGYHKTGTTWLQRQVFPDAEAGYALVAGADDLQPVFVDPNPFGFDPAEAHRSFERGIGEAREKGLIPVLSYERLSGSPHAGGYDSRPIADRLAAAFPDARVLVVIREQTSMVVSLYKVYIRMGGTASLRQYVDPPPQSSARAPLFRFDFLEYHRLVGYYQQLFGTENVLVLPYELLEKKPRRFLRRIGEFAGMSTSVKNARLRPVNVSPSAFSLSVKRQANKWLVRSALNPSPVLPLHLPNDSLRMLTSRIDRRLPARLRAGSDERWRRFAEELVGTRYAKSNALTAKLTGIDLWTFGYVC